MAPDTVFGSCRERRLVAVQTTYRALLPPDLHSSSDMSTALALSDTNMASSFETTSMADYTCDSSPNALASDHLLFGSFDEDESQVEFCNLLEVSHVVRTGIYYCSCMHFTVVVRQAS